MKICLASIHPRRLSGQIESLVALARELEGLGHQTRVISAFDDDVLFRRNGASPEQHDDRGGDSPIGKLTRLLRTSRRVAAAGRDDDLIHLNLPTPAFSWLADLVQLRSRPPMVVGYEAHLADPWRLICGPYLRHDPPFYLPRILINNGFWGRLSRYRCQRYVVASRWQRAELRALGVSDSRLADLPNLIDRQKLRRTVDGGRGCEGASVRRPPTVGWLGHFHHVKGVDVLLEAFGRVAERRPEARLALAWSGLGDERPIASRIGSLGLSERVDRLGRVDVAHFLSTLDVLALPYRLTIGQNAFPNLVLEAMQVGVPLVTSDLPLLRELVRDGRAALLARPGDAASLADALARLLDESALAAGLVAEQRALMSGELDSGALAGRYVELYREVLAEQAGVLQPRRRSASV